MSNPIVKGYYADPDIAAFGGKFYVYPTTDGGEGWNSTYFKAFSSSDLVNWADEGVILDLADVKWTGGVRAWAPAIAEKNGKYYYYYSGNRNIGAAYNDSPVGRFTDKGSPLINEGDFRGQMIDPDAFVDDDGRAYLYWGNGHMYSAELGEDMLSLKDGLDGVREITPTHFCEGSCIFKRRGVYYFTWCWNDTRSPDYEVRCGVALNPLDKPMGDTVILNRKNAEDRRIKCTGHHSILNVPGTDDWYICYHRFGLEKYGEVNDFSDEAGNHREVCIDKLEFNPDGTIKPVKATLEGVTFPVRY